ncbi:hypothetical protein A3A03_01795 [Candidatus Nomurabacteria bacterium RIFCSPLOWO2_01_FULL_40_18]|uniref:General secretion pathway GspH domain-containing protein n=1 Tax=Candidatus Nomurabacteria bacterium RIFCSPLOWO2_01_FULL_40_18 TaxID=1801773 RepID=A0A1F6XLZ8_9BACT|nr:MAG: hypothetical protein A3A03_01795 [Candidatus Nomurabacteria bacterium RIFCSPLOWO2_01_FULL_40_18]
MKNFYQKGLTAIELLVIVAVLGIIFSIVIPQFAKMRENQVFKSTVADVLSSLNKARSQTLASADSSSYGVHFQSDKVIIFKGTAFSSGDANNQTVNITSPAIISTITLTGGGANVYFNRLSGAPSVTGSIVVSSVNFTKTITISATGMASVN